MRGWQGRQRGNPVTSWQPAQWGQGPRNLASNLNFSGAGEGSNGGSGSQKLIVVNLAYGDLPALSLLVQLNSGRAHGKLPSKSRPEGFGWEQILFPVEPE